MRRTAILVSLLLLAAACASGGAGEFQDREWKLVSIDGFDALPAGVATPTVWFDRDGRFNGNTGCNSAGASYTVEGSELTIRALISTKRACVDPEGNRLERAYIGAIEKATRYRVEGGRLELLSADGAVVARFE